MIPELGLFLLILASTASLLGAGAVAWGLRRADGYLTGLWRPVGLFAAAAFLASAACLWAAFLGDDFSVAYVADNSNTGLENIYKFAAFWGSHEGSMMLWVVMIALWAAVGGCWCAADRIFMARLQAVMLALTGLFGVFLLATSNPFVRNLPLVPVEGRDLNPILQDVGMILHPPVLFMGYAGLALCFAAAVALLLGRRWEKTPVRFMTVSAVITWIFLTAGNALGSWWAYTELGWGGWWFWDPVENASFIPWLGVSALLHALILAQSKGQLKRLCVALALTCFAFCLLGTFIVRSGMMQSVHAFASDPNRGIALLIISAVVLVPAFTLYGFQVEACCRDSDAELSREDVLMTAGVFLLAAACAAVLIGTVYPLFYELFAGASLTVGAPYFNQFFAPMAIIAAVLIGILQALRAGSIVLAAALGLVSSGLAGAIVMLTDPRDALMAFAGIAAALWLLLTAAAGFLPGIKRLSLAATIAHAGIAVSMLGATGVSQYESEALVRMDPGSGKPVADVIFVNRGIYKVNTRAYFGDAARIEVLDAADESVLTELYPMRQTFVSSGMQMSAAGIEHGLFRDYYVSMGNKLSSTEWLVRLSVKPLASWIWAGAVIMMAAGAAILFRRRARSKA